ncbi:MAG: archaeosortase/exosortase family protein [Desulfamplus sp.]|nr:archaeosortase/exosortase family protein [Desulfamplus sp.]
MYNQNATSKKKTNVKKTRLKISSGKFILTYILLMSLFLLLIGMESITNIIDINGIYTTMIITLSAFFINCFGEAKVLSGSIIQLNNVALNVGFGCNGLEAFMIYIAAILSFPATKFDKLAGIVIGFIILQVINILRIVALGLVGIYLQEYFDYFHIYVAQGMMIVVSFIIFLLWLQYVTNKKNTVQHYNL